MVNPADEVYLFCFGKKSHSSLLSSCSPYRGLHPIVRELAPTFHPNTLVDDRGPKWNHHQEKAGIQKIPRRERIEIQALDPLHVDSSNFLFLFLPGK